MHSKTSGKSLGAKPVVLKCHPKRPDILAVGFESGEIVFVNCANLHTFSVPVSESALNFSGEKEGEKEIVAV